MERLTSESESWWRGETNLTLHCFKRICRHSLLHTVQHIQHRDSSKTLHKRCLFPLGIGYVFKIMQGHVGTYGKTLTWNIRVNNYQDPEILTQENKLNMLHSGLIHLLQYSHLWTQWKIMANRHFMKIHNKTMALCVIYLSLFEEVQSYLDILQSMKSHTSLFSGLECKENTIKQH